MLTKKDLKVLYRSGSFDFMRDTRSREVGAAVGTYMWHGTPIKYRPGTSDTTVIYEALLKSGKKSEYSVPGSLDPKVILDIGGNIGVASIFFARTFPNARIFSFEPVPENYALLKENVSSLANVSALPVALGSEDKEAEIYWSREYTNLGGFSFFEKPGNDARPIRVQVKHAGRYLRALGIEKVDLIKIDTEGAEFDILTSFDEAMLANASWIVGELHGIRDFEVLTYISRWFDMDVRRTLGKQYFMFNACNRNFLETALKSDWRQRR